MNGWNGHCELTEIMLKMTLIMIGQNQSLQTTQIKFDINNGINLLHWVRTLLITKPRNVRLVSNESICRRQNKFE